jgi:hypothetical protein
MVPDPEGLREDQIDWERGRLACPYPREKRKPCLACNGDGRARCIECGNMAVTRRAGEFGDVDECNEHRLDVREAMT